MDKLKPIIAAVKKFHFWVICGGIVLVVLVCWWMAAGGLAEQFRTQKSKIDGVFSSSSGIPADHPNQTKIDEYNKQHSNLKRNIYEAWEKLYREQKVKNPFPADLLGEDFQKVFDNLRPQEELARRYRERYQNFIKEYFPKLMEKIEVLRPVEPKPGEAAGNAAGGPRPGAMMPDMGGMIAPGAANAEQEWTGVIDWNPADYARLVARYEWQQTPSTLAVVLAQEDLWVYEALLRVIKSTNDGATNQSNALVKRIEALEIGRDAVAAWKNAENALGLQGQGGGAAGAGAGAGMDMPGMGAGSALPGGGGAPMGEGLGAGAAAGGATEEQINRQLFDFRYIDDKGQPLPFQPQYPFATHPYAEFKMMPIRMSLVMDQRKIPKLLVECANSNMPIEVRRVRLLKAQAPTSGTGTPGGGMGAIPGLGGGMGLPDAFPHGGAMGPGAGGSNSPLQETGQYDVPVEIHATIYIYNPPDREKLGTGAAAAAQPAGAPVPAPPAGQPPAPPAAPPGR